MAPAVHGCTTRRRSESHRGNCTVSRFLNATGKAAGRLPRLGPTPPRSARGEHGPMSTPHSLSAHSSRVPPVLLSFWVLKILATTVGETGGDALSMTLKLGYAVASLVFLFFFAVTLTA